MKIAPPLAPVSDADEFDFRSGNLSLDFLNTCGTHSPIGDEHLTSFAALVEWCRQAGILAAGDAERLGRSASARPGDAQAELEHAILFRESLYRLMLSSAGLGEASAADRKTLAGPLGNVMTHTRLVATPSGLERVWPGRPETPGSLLWPVVFSAAQLLASDALARLGQCAGTNCDWLFLIAKRGRARRWCSMSACGNRAKARRHYQRVKGSRDESAS